VSDHLRSLHQDVFDVFLTKLVASVLIVHERSIGSLLQELFNLSLGEGSRPCQRLLSICHPSVHALQDSLVQPQLETSSVEHFSLVGVLGHQPVDLHHLLLPDPVAPGLRLQVVLRVPVAVVDDARVRSGEVDAQATSLGAEQEDKPIRVWTAIPVDGCLSQVSSDPPIDPLKRIFSADQVILQDIQHFHHLGENQNAVAICLQLWQQFVQQDHLSTGVDKRFVIEVLVIREVAFPAHVVGLDLFFGPIEQIRVDAALSQLHHCVHQVWHIVRARFGKEREVFLENASIVLLLNVGQLHLNNGLLLGLQGLLHVLLHAPQHQRLEKCLQLDHLALLLHVSKVLHELGYRVELRWLQEGEKGEELVDVVLKRRSGQEKSRLNVQEFETFEQFAVLVLQTVSLVDNTSSPRDVLQVHDVVDDTLIRCDEHMELEHVLVPLTFRVLVVHLVLLDHVPARLTAMVHNHVHVCPQLELSLPVGNCGQRCNDKERPSNSVFPDVMDPGQRLDGFSQSHLVGKQAVVLVVPGEVEPVHPLELVRPQPVAVLVGGRLFELDPLLLVGTLNARPVLLGGGISPPLEVLDLLRVNVSLKLPGAVLVWEGPPLYQVVLGCDLSLFIGVFAGVKNSINLDIVRVEGFLIAEVEHVA